MAIRDSTGCLILYRDPERMESSLFFKVHVDENRRQAFEVSQRLLDEYYSANFSRGQIGKWTVHGPPRECAERLTEFAEAGVQLMCVTIRFFINHFRMLSVRKHWHKLAQRHEKGFYWHKIGTE